MGFEPPVSRLDTRRVFRLRLARSLFVALFALVHPRAHLPYLAVRDLWHREPLAVGWVKEVDVTELIAVQFFTTQVLIYLFTHPTLIILIACSPQPLLFTAMSLPTL